jgi:hypothetical protein
LLRAAPANPEEIDLGDDEEEEGEGEENDVQLKAVPAAVYGSLAATAAAAQKRAGEEEESGAGMGAMERLKKRRVE